MPFGGARIIPESDDGLRTAGSGDLTKNFGLGSSSRDTGGSQRNASPTSAAEGSVLADVAPPVMLNAMRRGLLTTTSSLRF
jgi:hypothetical protein